jgi:hypothetical protein
MGAPVRVSVVAGKKEFRFEQKALAGLAAFVMVCVLSFVKMLSIPMPILGSWLEPAAFFMP